MVQYFRSTTRYHFRIHHSNNTIIASSGQSRPLWLAKRTENWRLEDRVITMPGARERKKAIKWSYLCRQRHLALNSHFQRLDRKFRGVPFDQRNSARVHHYNGDPHRPSRPGWMDGRIEYCVWPKLAISLYYHGTWDVYVVFSCTSPCISRA